MEPRLAEAPIDLARMRRERLGKIRTAMASAGVDALVAIGLPNASYLSGAGALTADSARSHYERCTAVYFGGDSDAHVFTPYPDLVAADHPREFIHPSLALEFSSGVEALGRFLSEHLHGKAPRIAIDEATAVMWQALPALMSQVEWSDAASLFGPARLCKTDDELQCIRKAQQINEAAMSDVLATLRPGLRQLDLSALFLRRIQELGASSNEIDPIWQTVSPRLADPPFSVNGDVPFPRTSSDRMLREGDVIWVDTGITVHGYASDFGRTWIAARDPRPSQQQRNQFDRWRDVIQRVGEAIRPGNTGADLTRAACRGEARRPWMNHFYLAHGVGLNSAEMPLIGTDLGPVFDESIVLQPGMVLVLEPTIWQDGHAGYRSEEIVAVTGDGYRCLSNFSYTPFAEDFA